jgi:hypothetical protein
MAENGNMQTGLLPASPLEVLKNGHRLNFIVC